MKVEIKTENACDSFPSVSDKKPTYWLTRFLILRMLGFVYAVAFLVAINQILPLIGEHGLLPLGNFLRRVGNAYGSTGAGFVHLPSIFWFSHSDAFLLGMAWAGFIISCVVLSGYANAVMLTLLWILYMSFVHVGQDWYGYGWEIQLLETGFLAIFLCPLLDLRPLPKHPPPQPIIALFRWLIFRIMLGAGLIKMRWDEGWRNWTALYYHFETQPIPGPLSRWFHFLPRIVLKMGVWFNHIAELLAPWFVFWPRIGRHIAGSVIVLFQITLILSGNLSFLNWVTIIPALACFDDGFWAKLLPRQLVQRALDADEQSEPSRPMKAVAWIVVALVGFLSIQPAVNMISSQQIMNTSFDPLDLVNTYGAFGTVGRERLNIVFEGTMDDPTGDSTHWKAYPYKGLPVELGKSPAQIAPYQLRLDWQIWFASMSTPEEYPWTIHLISQLLHNDPGALSLFAGNPFPNKPPRYIRAVLYRYRFAKPGNPEGVYWHREQVGDLWLPPLATKDSALIEFLKRESWNP